MKLTLSISKKESELVHEQSLKILATMGLTVLSNAAVDVFKKAGAKIDGHQVYIDARMVEESLKTLPNHFSIYGNQHRVVIGKGDICTMPPYGGTYVSRNDQIRLGTRDDYINFTKLNHANEHINMSCPYSLEPFDVPLEHRDLFRMAMVLKYSDKPSLSLVGSRENAERSIEMIKRYRDISDDYVALGNVNISAPLIMGDSTSEAIMVHCEENQPLMIACGSGLSGLTAPPTHGGNLLLANAAILSGIVFSQILKPGLPVVYGLPLFGVDPYKAETLVGNSAAALFTLAAKGMSDYYNMPFRAGGTFTDAKHLDYQSGYESCLNLLSCLLAEVDCLMHSFGMEDSLKTINYNKYILDEWMYHGLKDYKKGFEINDVTLMMDEILRTGSTGNFISSTNLKLIRKEYSHHGFGEGKTMEETLKKTDAEIEKRLENYKLPHQSKNQKEIIRGYLPDEYID
ncbi:trimethylamine methyltransferase family protein [Acetobacterium bakii]|uniref:Trimethylamine methyltransferase n=1 Tax=Acetobacterium bakii TaxID=52689 RepID=A0A0L6U3A7_9FIRM|nr:trimethylamine methyltransferase family protein [Acetobacterium bakii]KNZ42993.1 hypothetical protein AKG39_04570 [Acetobacterium bakii]